MPTQVDGKTRLVIGPETERALAGMEYAAYVADSGSPDVTIEGLLLHSWARELRAALVADAATPDPHGPAVRALVQRIATLPVTHLADCNLQEEMLAARDADAGRTPDAGGPATTQEE